MDKKIIRIITVIATTLLCGLPGLVGLCLGVMAIMGILLPDSSVQQDEVAFALGSSITLLGLSLICTILPIGIGFWAWWSHKKETASMEMLILPEDDF